MFNHTQRTITGQSPAAGMRNDRQPYIPAFQSWQLTPSHSLGVRHRRGGAVIIVVLALLSLMIFLGVFFFEFTQEEQLAAQNYAVTNQFLDPEPYFEEAEKQLIIGPDASRSMSPLSAGEVGQDNFSTTAPAGIVDGTPGTPHSLIAHIIGRMQRTTTGVKPTDLLPHNGHGVTVTFQDNNSDQIYGPGDYAFFDMDGDGIPDATLPGEDADGDGVLDTGEDIVYPDGYLQPAFGINFSRPAQPDPLNDAFSQANTANALRPFQPDVEYTYPDINNPFLAYDRTDPITGRRILAPTFHRPDLFPTMRSSGFADLYTDPATMRLVMRPHREHRYPDNTPGDRTDNVRRYLVNSAGTQAQSGDKSRVIFPFPFQVDSDNDGSYNEMGIYSDVSTTEVGYDLDVDLTGDGKPDGIWIDSGDDLIDLPDGRQMVPMFSFHVIDADALININSAGNLQGAIVNGVLYDSGIPFSVSNTGASASEINLQRALTGRPDSYPYSTPAEIAVRQKVLAEHVFGYASLDPLQPITPLTMANIELAFMLGGRIQSRSSSRLSGRYGEQNLIGSGTPPSPGITNVDDDLDNTPDSARYQGGAQRSKSIYDPRGGGTTTVDVVIPYASHPIAPKGTGSSAITSSGATAGQRILNPAVSGSPVVFPEYPNSAAPTPNSGWEAPQVGTIPSNSVPVVSAVYPYPSAPISDPLGSTLFPSGTTDMYDEEDETRLRNPDRVYDDIYRPEENITFQVSEADRQRMGGNMRAEMIAPFNFKYAHDAQDIRKRFTTDSWDLSELTYVPGRYSSGTGYNETSEWTSGRRFFPPDFKNPSSTIFTDTDPIRPEVRALLALEDTNYPSSSGSSRRETNTFPLISGGSGVGTAQLWRQPLNLNKLLVGFDSKGYPIFRDLMPHPDIEELEYIDTGDSLGPISIPAMIHGNDSALVTGQIPATAAFSNISSAPTTDAVRAQTATAMEWWARYDRQRMARDIFTLLYIVGAPDIDFDLSTPATKEGPATKPYLHPEMVREMAQFAVNYVDALDRDDVVTKFEYDNNLSDGWSWSSGGPVVYGVERASLSFSEVQFLQTKPRTDVATTLHDDDEMNVHQYLHMELRNSSPYQVDLAEGWRISRVMRDVSGNGTGTRDKSVEFKTSGFGTASAITKFVRPGGNFLIGTHDGNVVNGGGAKICSDLYADVADGAELELILPSSTDSSINTVPNDSADPNPLTDLDLGVPSTHPHFQYFDHIAGDTDSRYQNPIPPLTPPKVPPTHLVRQIDGTLPSTPAVPETNLTFDLVLERRQNLKGIKVGGDTSSMGDWIEVDRFQVRSRDMGTLSPDDAVVDIANPGAQAEVQAALTNLHSVERRQPFDPTQFEHIDGMMSNHTMAVTAGPTTSPAANSIFTGTSFTLWQPHFDRDFTSVYELMSVPLYGNWPLSEIVAGTHTGTTASTPAGTLTTNTFYKEIHGGTQFNLAPGATASGSGLLSGDFTAGIRFNFPNGLPGSPYQGWNEYNYQNAWYRLFDFVAVHRRADQQSEELISGDPGSTKPVFRVPGKVNLNTLRDESVLAAVIDDEVHLTYGNTYSTNDKLTTTPLQRNWFSELLQSRDGTDYFANLASSPQVAIPNSINSRPFRSASKPDPYATATFDEGVENGLLRSVTRRGSTTLELRPEPQSPYATPSLTSPASFMSIWAASPPSQMDTLMHARPAERNWQGLFDSGDLANTGIDHHTRNRILAKIANNSTMKSHVFFVWTAVGYFEAHKTSGGYVQIGARLNDIPIHRRFSVVDMSKLDEAYNTSSNTFDETKFIIFQKRLR
jgi:hypothetical protein